MKHLLLIISILSLLFSSSAAVEWEEIKCDLKTDPASVLQSGDTIYIGHYGIAKSTDGGKTFKKINKVVDGDREYDLADEGFSVLNLFKSENGSLVAAIEGVGLIYSDNDGELWNISNLKQNMWHNSTKFAEVGNVLYIYGRVLENDSLLFKSTNRGENWHLVTIESNKWLKVSYFEFMPDKKQFLITGQDSDSNDRYVYYDPVLDTITDIQFEPPDGQQFPQYYFKNDDIISQDFSSPILYKYDIDNKSWNELLNLDSLVYATIDTNRLKFPQDEWERKHSTIIQNNGALIYYITLYINGSRHISDTKEVAFLSYDFGNSWILYNQLLQRHEPYVDQIEISKYDGENIFRKLYGIGGAEYKLYNKESKNHTDLSFNTNLISTIKKYRKYEDSEICVLLNTEYPVWINQQPDGWKKVSYLHDALPTFEKSVYGVEDGNLYYYDSVKDISKSLKDTLCKNIAFRNRFLTDYYITFIDSQIGNKICLIENLDLGMDLGMRGFGKRVIRLYENQKNIGEIDTMFFSFENNADGEFVAINYRDYLKSYIKWNSEEEWIDTLDILIGDIDDDEFDKLDKEVVCSYNIFPKIKFEDDVIILTHQPGVEITRDKGDTWTKFLATPQRNYDFKIYDKEIYLKNKYALLRSHDGNYWENILEGTSKAKVIDFEFDPDGYAYVYTTNGAYISKETMEDSGKAWNEEDIDLEFNLSNDKKSVQIVTSSRIKNVEASELKQELKLVSNNTYDLSTLESENYCLRVEFDNGKVVYKQLVLANEE